MPELFLTLWRKKLYKAEDLKGLVVKPKINDISLDVLRE
jgi:hypothetical protein